jgi:DNA-binding transcriptional LysR family regulator
MVFLEAAECGNFSETGRNLHLSQPAISQKIDNLQKHFGTKLFYREGRCMQLTETGQVLIPLAKELISVARRVDETMISLQGEVIGEMNLGCSTASGKYILPSLIAQFRKLYPSVRINVQVTSRDIVFNNLLSGDFAVGISSKKIPHQDLEYARFFQDEVILIVPSNHPWSLRTQIQPKEILSEPIILREENAGSRDVFLHGLQEHGISLDMLNIAMELGNAEAIEMAVEQGIGIAFISRLAAARCIDHGYIKKVGVEGMPLVRDIYLTRSKRTKPTRAQLEFWNFISSANIDVRQSKPAFINIQEPHKVD